MAIRSPKTRFRHTSAQTIQHPVEVHHGCHLCMHGSASADDRAGGGSGFAGADRGDLCGLFACRAGDRGARAGDDRHLQPPRHDVRGLFSHLSGPERGGLLRALQRAGGGVQRGIRHGAGQNRRATGRRRRPARGHAGPAGTGAGPRRDGAAVLHPPGVQRLQDRAGGPVRAAAGGPLPAGPADPAGGGGDRAARGIRRQRRPVPQAAALRPLRL